jgi:hypothetical protein
VIWTVLGTIAIIGATIAIGVVIDRKVGILPRRELLLADGKPRLKLPPHAPGAAPETALATPPGEVACSACEAATRLEGDSPVAYDGRALTARRYRCTRCAATTTIYVVG